MKTDSTGPLRRVMQLACVLAALAFLGAGLSACQTVKGMGEDITNLGEAGEDAIND